MRSSIPDFQDALRVLVVDDSIVMHGVVAAVLAKFPSVQHDAVTCAADAMRMLADKNYALVITDINMPNINGLELLAYIRQSDSTADVPVLIVSSNGASSDQERGFKLGANGYLVKPFKNEDLEASVRRLLSEKR
jgi:two-component system chemotaxis response regulator CheY